MRLFSKRCLSMFVAGALCIASNAQQPVESGEVEVDWAKVLRISKSTPTLQVVANPQLLRGAKLHDASFNALQMLGADYVRYVPWFPYPQLAVAELAAPKDGKTSWDFAHIDPLVDDVMEATKGKSVILNFSTIPSWMYKTDAPVDIPKDPNQVFWSYTQGTELRDPSMKEISEYYAHLLGWYTAGGFTDEYGKRFNSGHYYKVPYWEVLNEIDGEHHWTPEQYTKFYDSVTSAMRKVNPNIKFIALALAYPEKNPEMFEYFLNPSNHAKGTPLDFISYHFYATPTSEQTLDDWQYTFFDQADSFVNTIRFIENIRKHYSPSTKTDLDELGAILTEDSKEILQPGYVAKPEPKGYWNLAGAMYAYLYVQAALLGVDVIGESQLVGYPSQFPSVSMMNYNTASPNVRYWVLKMLKDNFGPGDKLAETKNSNGALLVQGFVTKQGKALLIINKRDHVEHLTLPEDALGASLDTVAESTSDSPPNQATLRERSLVLQPFQVSVVRYR